MFQAIWRRRVLIIVDWRLYLSGFFGWGVSFALWKWAAGAPSIKSATFGDAATLLIAYSSITFAACVAGATLAIGLPGGRMLGIFAINGSDKVSRRLNFRDGKYNAVVVDTGASVKQSDFGKSFRSNYQDLVFTFLYSALIQIVLAVFCVLVMLFAGGYSVAPGSESSPWHWLILILLAFLAGYSLLQLAASLVALMNLAVIRDSSVRGAAVEGDLGRLEP